MTRKVVAIEGGEGEVSGAVLWDVLRNRNGKQFEINALKLDD